MSHIEGHELNTKELEEVYGGRGINQLALRGAELIKMVTPRYCAVRT